MTNTKHKNNELFVNNLVHNSVVTYPNTHLPFAANELLAARWPRVVGKLGDRDFDPSGSMWMNASKYLGRTWRDNNLERHEEASTLQAKLFHQLIKWNMRPAFTSRLRCSLNIGEIFKRFNCPVEEVWRYHHGTAPHASRSNLYRLALRGGDVVTLPFAELRKSHGSHVFIVRLVQDGHNNPHNRLLGTTR